MYGSVRILVGDSRVFSATPLLGEGWCGRCREEKEIGRGRVAGGVVRSTWSKGDAEGAHDPGAGRLNQGAQRGRSGDSMNTTVADGREFPVPERRFAWAGLLGWVKQKSSGQ